ncbi:MAG: uncharacterized protein A8A55_3592, partial [Amphiamblys sp. WSBS2006]
TIVEIQNRIILTGHDNSLERCLGEFDQRTNEQATICFDGYSEDEMGQVCSNIKTIPRNSIQTNAGEIHAKGNGICVLLKLLGGADRYTPNLFLESTRKDHIEETLQKERHLAWIGRAKKLNLYDYAVGILPALSFHGENRLE